jgi:hypothetical protein
MAQARATLTELAERAAAGDRAATPSEQCASCDFLTFCEEGKAFVENRGRTVPEGVLE